MLAWFDEEMNEKLYYVIIQYGLNSTFKQNLFKKYIILKQKDIYMLTKKLVGMKLQLKQVKEM